MTSAIGNQLHGEQMAGWRALATKYMSATPPSVEALKAAGYSTRKSFSKAGDTEVFISKAGMGWLSLKAAARSGLI